MNKKLIKVSNALSLTEFKHIFRVMKLTSLFGVLCVSSAFAINVNSQSLRVNIHANQKQAKEVIKQIEEQTDYLFVYNHDKVNLNNTVTIQANNETVAEVLNQMFAGTDIIYAMQGNNILLMQKDAVVQQSGKVVTGTIVDPSGMPVIGANVMVKGTTNGTITDMDGKFSLEVGKDAILVVSYVGYANQEISIGNQKTLSITLKEDSEALDELVVVGYGAMKKSDLTGSVSNIKSDKLLDRVSTSIGQALQGRVPGVDIVQNQGTPGGNMSVRIRGNNSITSSNDPLWVVDGIVGAWNINNINPNDIESIEVLKDASSTAIYGARGANGVIIVTTKRGFKSKSQISYDGSLSLGTISKKIELLNAEQFMQVYNEAFNNAVKYDPIGVSQGKHKPIDPKDYPNLFYPDGSPIYDTDWQDEVYKKSLSHHHQLSVRGGVEKVQYGIFLGVVKEDGLMRTSYYDRYSGRLTLDVEPYKWLKISSMISLVNSKENLTHRENENMTSVARHTIEALPIMPVRFPSGNYSTVTDFPGWEIENPVKILNQSEHINNIIQGMGSLSLDLIFYKDLVFRSNISVDLGSSKTNKYRGKDLIAISATEKGKASISTNMQRYWQNENYLTYDHTFDKKHHLTAMMGVSWMERYWETSTTNAENFSDDFYKWHNLGAATTLKSPASGDSYWRLNSYYTRLNYVFNNRYLFTFTGRIDGSSKFGKNNKYAFFPSAALAWRISEEKFLEDCSRIDNLKIRASIGQTGNQEIGQYQSLQFLGSGNTILNNDYQPILYKSSFGNSDLKWEKTTQMDVGIDVNMLGNRVNLCLDYYYKRTKDLLLSAPIPTTAGLNSVLMNIGELENKGFEIQLTTANFQKKIFLGIQRSIGLLIEIKF